MLRKGLYIALISSLVIGVGFFSGCRRHGHHRGAEFAVDYATEVLDLTDTQQQQLNQIKDELVAKREQMHANKEKYHDEVVALLLAEEIDQARVKEIIVVLFLVGMHLLALCHQFIFNLIELLLLGVGQIEHFGGIIHCKFRAPVMAMAPATRENSHTNNKANNERDV